jgi:hypothetical protein
MRRLVVLMATVLGIAAPALAGEVSVPVLISDGAVFDDQTITVEGELVGDFQRRGAWVWVQLNGDSYADSPAPAGGELTGSNIGIAVRFASDAFDAAGFERPGGYGVRGPVVRVTGDWRYHDEERGGESYLAVDSFEVLERERRFEEEMPWAVLAIGLGVAAAGALILLGSRLSTRRRSARARESDVS